jgi:anti-sigma factor RsiW
MEMDRCRDVQPFLPACAAGFAEPGEEMRVETHLAMGCAACAAELEQLYEAFHALPLAFAAPSLSEAAAERLAQSVGGREQETHEVPILFPETRERRLLWTLLACFVLALLAAAFWGRDMQRRLERAEREAMSAQQQTRSVVADYRKLDEKCRALIKAMDEPEGHGEGD